MQNFDASPSPFAPRSNAQRAKASRPALVARRLIQDAALAFHDFSSNRQVRRSNVDFFETVRAQRSRHSARIVANKSTDEVSQAVDSGIGQRATRFVS